MEKKNMDKIDTLYDYVVQKREELKERKINIYDALYNEDMKNIMRVLADHYIDTIAINNDSIEFASRNGRKIKCFDLYINCYGFEIHDIVNKTYDSNMIDKLSNRIEYYKELEQRILFIENNIGEIVSKITDKYKEITEKESDRLDKLLSLIDYDTTPMKHLKITVEWI